MGNPVWQFISAAKVVEDIASYRAMDGDAGLILDINFLELPHNEDPAIMRAYSQIQKTLYQQPPTLEHYREFWISLSDEPELIDSVMRYTQEMLASDLMRTAIQQIYQRVLSDDL